MKSLVTPGQYATVPGGGFVCACIRCITRAPVAHAFIYIGEQADGTDMVEAQAAGVRRYHSDAYGTIYPGPAPEPAVGLAIANTAAALATRDTDYNFLADFYIGMREGLRIKIPPWLFRLASTSKHVECAQLVDYCYLTNGVHLFEDGRAPGSVSPADLWKLTDRGTT